MPKLRVIIKPPPEPTGDAERDVEALRDYLLQVSEELAYLLTHLEADNINDTTFERIQSMIPRPYTGLPVMDGDASSGQSEQWSRGDHRHGHDSSKADVTALEETAGDLADHVADIGNPHEVTAAQVGLGNVDNVRQYSVQNPPPTPSAADVGAIPTTEKGSAGGVAELDSGGHVPSSQLPSYVDDVKEYPTVLDFPIPGESDKIYIALDTDLFYRWGGTVYAPTNPSLALGETSSTAYRGDRGKTAYDHSQVTSGNPHNVTAAEVGARPDTWTPSASDVGAQPTITASGMLKGDGLGGVSAATAGTDYQTPLVAGTDYQTPLVAGTDYATPAQIPAVPDPSDAAPQDLGTAAAGSSGDYSRADHVHNLPDADDIPYDNTGSGLSATDVQAAIDEVAQGGGGGGPSPATATPVMDGAGAVGVSLLYAREDHEHPSDTAKQPTITANGILKGDGQGGVSAATAGTDYQTPLVAGTDYATPGMIPTVPSAYTSNPAMDGTASPGSSSAWAKGDHVHPSDTSRVPVYGLGKNLLDNAYFLNPVNQRGQASYGSSQYGIDRWKTTGGSALTVNDGFVAASSTTTNQYWQQNIEQSRLIDGAQYTISVLIKAVTGTPYLRFQLDASPWTWFVSKQITGVGIIKETFTWNADAGYTGLLRAAIKLETGESASVVAMKLELGTEQTLAHQENGTWVLNEIPDYAEELRKCQRYFIRYAVSSAQKIADAEIQTATSASCLIFLPVTMRQVTPTVQIGSAVVYQGASNKGNASLSSATLYGNILALGITASGMTPASVGRLILMSSYLNISCEL